MAKSKSADGPEDITVGGGESAVPAIAPGSNTAERAKPVHEERIGVVKALVWANPTANGVRHNVTFKRIFKREGSSTWEESDSFPHDQLPVLMEVIRRAYLSHYANGQP